MGALRPSMQQRMNDAGAPAAAFWSSARGLRHSAHSEPPWPRRLRAHRVERGPPRSRRSRTNVSFAGAAHAPLAVAADAMADAAQVQRLPARLRAPVASAFARAT